MKKTEGWQSAARAKTGRLPQLDKNGDRNELR